MKTKSKVTFICTGGSVSGIVVLEKEGNKTVGYVEGSIESLAGQEIEKTIITI